MEGEGSYEGELCIWNDTCPNFEWQGTKYAQFLGQSWDSCDSNNSSIPDSWEIAVVKYLLCSPTGIWDNRFICKFIENYNQLAQEPWFHTTYFNFRYVLTGLITLGINIDQLKTLLMLTKDYTPFEYPDGSGIIPLIPSEDIDNDGLTNYEEYQMVVSFNGTKESFISNLFNPPPTLPFHSADTNQDSKISLQELLRMIQFFNSGGLHCELGTEDGYAPGYNENFDFSCTPHTADYSPQDWRINLTEILRLVQFLNSAGYELCPFLSEDHYCPIFAE